MEKRLNRALVSELSERIQEIISEGLKDDERYKDFDIVINGGSFADDKAKLNLEIRLLDSDGSIVISDAKHSIVDAAAKKMGIKFSGHILGSMWSIGGKSFIVRDYITKRNKYPLSMKRSDGRLVKAPLRFLATGNQIEKPTKADFFTWFTVDPDSDAVLETDAEICDNVQAYMELAYPMEDGDKFFELVDKFNEEGIAKKWANRAYELLFKEKNSMATAYLGLKVIYKETKKENEKGKRN